jgi:hypothetical protein
VSDKIVRIILGYKIIFNAQCGVKARTKESMNMDETIKRIFNDFYSSKPDQPASSILANKTVKLFNPIKQ